MSPVRRFAAGMVVAVVALFAAAAPASAHDELTASTPAAGERLEAAPENIRLQFSGDVLSLGDTDAGTLVMVVDATGRDWSDGSVEVFGETVTVGLTPGMPDAGYQVRWRVVSEDGHPISGVIPFAIGDAEPLTATDDGGTDRSDDAEERPSLPAEETTPPSGTLRLLLIGAGGAAVAVAAFALFRLLRRRRTAPATPDDSASANDEL